MGVYVQLEFVLFSGVYPTGCLVRLRSSMIFSMMCLVQCHHLGWAGCADVACRTAAVAAARSLHGGHDDIHACTNASKQ
jgi:hypothetical protein